MYPGGDVPNGGGDPLAGDVPRVRRIGAVRQQRARLRGRQRRRRRDAEGRDEGGHGHGLVLRARVRYDDRVAELLDALLLHVGQDRREGLEAEPELVRRPVLSTSSTRSTIMCSPRRSDSPRQRATSRSRTHRAKGRRGRRPRTPPRRREHGQRVPRRRSRQQRELLHPARRRARHHADVPAAAAPVGSRHPARRLGQRGRDRVSRVRPRVVQPTGHDPRRHPRAERAAVGIDGRGLGRLVRGRLHRQPGLVHRHAGQRGRDRVPVFRRRRGVVPDLRGRLPGGCGAENCPVDGIGTGPGGYTYADFGDIIGQPEVHADGEIWLQTLWQLREELGSAVMESLVTRGMELSPPEPSFLDMRERDPASGRGRLRRSAPDAALDDVRQRGMGYYAAAADGSDVNPVADFETPRTARSTRAERSPGPSRTPCRAARS